jgi:cytochrome c peroxidase
VNQIVRLPTFPNTSLLSEVGLAGSTPGYRFMEQNNALAAFQNTLLPPPAPLPTTPEAVTRGRAVFAQAGCADCHAGPEATNHRIIPVPEIGTDPSRAQALRTTEPHYVPPSLYGFDTPVPIPPGTPPLAVPTAELDPHQL